MAKRKKEQDIVEAITPVTAQSLAPKTPKHVPSGRPNPFMVALTRNSAQNQPRFSIFFTHRPLFGLPK